jgi:hypothetical protein
MGQSQIELFHVDVIPRVGLRAVALSSTYVAELSASKRKLNVVWDLA